MCENRTDVSGLAHSLEQVRMRISEAAARAGRDPASVTLIAVSKIFPADAIREAYQLGLRDFGENYVQEFEGKAPQVRDLEGARFHLIGHLQSNKARKAAELFHSIQTIDSEKLARRLNDAGKPLDVMIEVKLSPEESKSGTGAGSLPALVQTVRALPNLKLLGLMTMPPWSEDPEVSRPYFRRLRQLVLENGLSRLSMGMSHDLEAAIEEGATDIRVGTALFGSRKRE
jgi:pyridoxal phosphate enzyme (YggS family)